MAYVIRDYDSAPIGEEFSERTGIISVIYLVKRYPTWCTDKKKKEFSREKFLRYHRVYWVRKLVLFDPCFA